ARERWLPAPGLFPRLAERFAFALCTGRSRRELQPTLDRFAPGLRWRQGPSCPGNLGQDRRARRAKFGTARPCRVATLGKGREASGARPQPETARERTRMYVTEPETARTKRRAAYRPAPLIFAPQVCADDVARGKPDPEGLRLIQAACPGRRCWFVGDTVDDARAARAAGVTFIGVVAPGHPHRARLRLRLEQERAAALLDDVNQLAWRQGPSCPGNMGQDRRARRAKFGTARPCRVATLGKGREASGARPQPE